MTPSPSIDITRRDAVSRLALGTAALGLSRRSDVRYPQATRDEDRERLLRLARVPSYVMARVQGDQVTTKAGGVLRVATSERAGPDTIYAAASLTKPVFAYAFLGLVREGRISLDAPIGEYLPLPNPDDPRGARILVRHLLSHSSGWRNWRNTAAQQLVAEFDPGSAWSYSGEGFFFLQRVAERVSGRPIGRILRERVFDPLGMTQSSLLPTEAMRPRRAVGHDRSGQPGRVFGADQAAELERMTAERGGTVDDVTVEDAEAAMKVASPTLPVLPNFMSPNVAASLLTTATDYGRFLRHLVTARRRRDPAAAIVDLMMTPQVRCNEVVQWGLGAGLEDVAGSRCAWQWGDNPGFKNYMCADPAREDAIVVFSNGDRGQNVYERIVRAETGADHPGFLWI